MKKSLLLLLILNAAVLNLFAKPSKKTLVEQGLYLASLMKEKATPDTKAFSPVLRKEFELSMLSGFPALWNFSANL